MRASANCRIVLDQEILNSIRDLQSPEDPDVLAKVVRIFLSHLPTRVEKIAEAMTSGDPAAIRLQAHALRSSAANLGAMLLTEAAAKIEDTVRKGGSPTADAMNLVREEASRAEQALRELPELAGVSPAT